MDPVRPITVSVITPTWQRHEQLLRAIASVEAQTVKDWEHLIISDGPSAATFAVAQGDRRRVIELGRNWHAVSGENCGGIPRLVGAYLACGRYLAYLDDDNEWLPTHLEKLLAKIEEGFDWVYSRMQRYGDGVPLDILGDGQPRLYQIDTNILMHRWELVRHANWEATVYADDWQLVEKWLAQGRTWAWVPEVTVKYHAWRST